MSGHRRCLKRTLAFSARGRLCGTRCAISGFRAGSGLRCCVPCPTQRMVGQVRGAKDSPRRPAVGRMFRGRSRALPPCGGGPRWAAGADGFRRLGRGNVGTAFLRCGKGPVQACPPGRARGKRILFYRGLTASLFERPRTCGQDSPRSPARASPPLRYWRAGPDAVRSGPSPACWCAVLRGSCGSGGSCHTESIRPAAPSRLPEGRPFPFNRPTGDRR